MRSRVSCVALPIRRADAVFETQQWMLGPQRFWVGDIERGARNRAVAECVGSADTARAPSMKKGLGFIFEHATASKR